MKNKLTSVLSILLAAVVVGGVVAILGFIHNACAQPVPPLPPGPVVANSNPPKVLGETPAPRANVPEPSVPATPAQPEIIWTGTLLYYNETRPIVDAQIAGGIIVTNRVHTNLVQIPFEIGIHKSGVLVVRPKQ